MARQSVRRASPRNAGAPEGRSERPSPGLKVAPSPAAARRSIGRIVALAVLCLFAVGLALALLHPVVVGNQGSLDDLIEHNEQLYERIDQLQAEIAYLDSPEGLAEQAQSGGLVPAAELAVLTPVGPGRLPPPDADPFDLESSGWTPPPSTTAATGPLEHGKPTR